MRVVKTNDCDNWTFINDVLEITRIDADGDLWFETDFGKCLLCPDQVELVEAENQEVIIDSQVSYVLSNLPLGEPLEIECCYNAMTEQEIIKEFDSGCKGGFIERGDKYMVYKLVPYKVLEIGTKETLV